MPKPMFVWSGTQWLSVASEVESLANFATQSYADSQPGMKLIVPSSVTVGSGSGSVSTQGTVTFSGASSVSLNDVFSTTYDHYKIIVTASSSTTAADLVVRLRVSGSDLTTNGYASSLIRGRSDGSTIIQLASTSGYVVSASSNTSDLFAFDVTMLSPFISGTRTRLTGTWETTESSTLSYGGPCFGHTQNTTSYTGMTIVPSAGTLTGTVSVYGYKD